MFSLLNLKYRYEKANLENKIEQHNSNAHFPPSKVLGGHPTFTFLVNKFQFLRPNYFISFS